MATCSLTGTLVDPSATAISGATIAASVVSPQFDVAGNLVMPFTISTTSNSSGVWTLVLDQGISVTLTIQYPPNSTDSTRRYNYNFVVPSASSQTFNAAFITEL
jgi:hypothetical protein